MDEPDAARGDTTGTPARRASRGPVRTRVAGLLAATVVGALAGCGSHPGGDAGAAGPSADGASAAAEAPGITAGAALEVRFSGLGTHNPTSDVVWLDARGIEPTGSATREKAVSTPATLAAGLDMSPLWTQVSDIGGFRYVSAAFRVRNAQSCGTPGTCAPYGTSLFNAAFMAAGSAATLNGTAIQTLTRANGTAASPALATQMLPTHKPNATGAADPAFASLQVYREGETPAFAAPTTTVFPYGFVVRNVNTGLRTLPANPAVGQYDGTVAIAYRVPLQANPADNPASVSIRMIATSDPNTRVTQSLQERDAAGDNAANARAIRLGSQDVVVLGSSRLAQTHAGNPVCRVRIAGTAVSPTAFLVNEPAAAGQLLAAPIGQENVPRDTDVSLGFCETMTPPTAARFVVHGSMSGRRVAGGAYGGAPDGGLGTTRSNQLLWRMAGQRPFHPNETVTVTATSANTTNAGLVPIAKFVGQYRVQGSTVPTAGGFQAGVAHALGAGPKVAVLGDVNRDGVLDIVTTTFANTLVLRLGTGGGNFGPATSFHPGTVRDWIVLGDVDGDGRLDIVSANPVQNSVSVMLGNGAGSFGAPASFAVGSAPVSVALGDFNGDGHPDIATANLDSNSVSVLLGTGTGAFGAATSLAMGVQPLSVTVGDVNRDGRMDLVTANAGSNTVSVRLGTGNGGFGAATDHAVGTVPTSVALGDLNGDGRVDIVTANREADSVSVLLGTGSGGFAAATSHGVWDGPVTVALGDVNGDGRLDIVTANRNSGSVSVRLGLGDGSFGALANHLTIHPHSAALGDMNADGRLDIVTANGNFSVSVLAGQ